MIDEQGTGWNRQIRPTIEWKSIGGYLQTDSMQVTWPYSQHAWNTINEHWADGSQYSNTDTEYIYGNGYYWPQWTDDQGHVHPSSYGNPGPHYPKVLWPSLAGYGSPYVNSGPAIGWWGWNSNLFLTAYYAGSNVTYGDVGVPQDMHSDIRMLIELLDSNRNVVAWAKSHIQQSIFGPGRGPLPAPTSGIIWWPPNPLAPECSGTGWYNVGTANALWQGTGWLSPPSPPPPPAPAPPDNGGLIVSNPESEGVSTHYDYEFSTNAIPPFSAWRTTMLSGGDNYAPIVPGAVIYSYYGGTTTTPDPYAGPDWDRINGRFYVGSYNGNPYGCTGMWQPGGYYNGTSINLALSYCVAIPLVL